MSRVQIVMPIGARSRSSWRRGSCCRATGIVNPLLLPPLSDVLAMLGELLQRAQVHEAIWRHRRSK